MAAMWPLTTGLLLLFSLLVSPSIASSPMVFEIKGDVYPTSSFFVTLHIGIPPKPYYLHIDTGSDLTWLQCDAPCQSCNKVPHLYRLRTNKQLLRCVDRRCAALHRDLTGEPPNCNERPNQCDYDSHYADGSSSKGVLLLDSLSLPAAPSNASSIYLTFGCGYNQNVGENFKVPVPVDGILGLGRGLVSLVSQLKGLKIVRKHVVGHCLGSSGRSFLFLGEDGEDLLPPSGVTWVPMAKSRTYYSPAGSATLCFNGQPLGGVKSMPLIFDSGSTFTYFASQPYQATITAVKSTLSRSLTEVKDPKFPLCWKGNKPFKTVHDTEKEFKPLSFRFAIGNDTASMEIPPARYLFVTKDGNVCLGIFDASANEDLGQSSVIGSITMLDQIVVHDNQRGRLGWVNAACDRRTSSESVITSHL